MDHLIFGESVAWFLSFIITLLLTELGEQEEEGAGRPKLGRRLGSSLGWTWRGSRIKVSAVSSAESCLRARQIQGRRTHGCPTEGQAQPQAAQGTPGADAPLAPAQRIAASRQLPSCQTPGHADGNGTIT